MMRIYASFGPMPRPRPRPRPRTMSHPRVHLPAIHSFGGGGGCVVPSSLSLTSCLDREEGGIASAAVVKLRTV
jgi:hypothetical protein